MYSYVGSKQLFQGLLFSPICLFPVSVTASDLWWVLVGCTVGVVKAKNDLMNFKLFQSLDCWLTRITRRQWN